METNSRNTQILSNRFMKEPIILFFWTDWWRFEHCAPAWTKCHFLGSHKETAAIIMLHQTDLVLIGLYHLSPFKIWISGWAFIKRTALKSHNIQYITLGRWDKWLINQASDVPSIIFFHNFLWIRALKTLYFFYKKKKEKKKNWNDFCKEFCKKLWKKI